MQAVALKPEHVIPVSGLAVPPLVVMTVGMRTTLKPKTSENEICMISCLIHHEFPINKAAPQPPFQTHFCGECLFFSILLSISNTLYPPGTPMSSLCG